MKNLRVFLLIIVIIFTSSCNQDDDGIKMDAETASLVTLLDQEMTPLDTDPLSWKDEELTFLDPIAEKPMVGLGEATHGTSEFFKAKHRIFRYLVEKHDFKVFAFEADFGESLLINEAVLAGNTGEIENVMLTNMHFWIWATEEVKDLLQWMAEYNRGKSDDEKIHYVGVDCQYNTFHPDMVKDYLQKVGYPFLSSAQEIMSEAKEASENDFESYTMESFDSYLEEVNDLVDSMEKYRNDFVASSSEKEYELHKRILEVVAQVSQVKFVKNKNYRDQYMAENSIWYADYFEDQKIALWAHNAHIANDPYYNFGKSQGKHLKDSLGDAYAAIGFLFSQGDFKAVKWKEGGLEVHTISAHPEENSVNGIFWHSTEPVFYVSIADLNNHSEWNETFDSGIRYLSIGAAFNDRPKNFYRHFNSTLFDHLIYIDHTTASDLLY